MLLQSTQCIMLALAKYALIWNTSLYVKSYLQKRKGAIQRYYGMSSLLPQLCSAAFQYYVLTEVSHSLVFSQSCNSSLISCCWGSYPLGINQHGELQEDNFDYLGLSLIYYIYLCCVSLCFVLPPSCLLWPWFIFVTSPLCLRILSTSVEQWP